MRIFITIIAALSFSCSAIVEDFETAPCDPDPPQTCADLGDAEAQILGCCNEAATKVYYCEGGTLQTVDCNDLTCDYEPDQEIMPSVD